MPALSPSGQRTRTPAPPDRGRETAAAGPRIGLGLAPKIALIAVLITFLGLTAVTALGYAFITAGSREEAGQQLEGRANNVARVIDARVASALQSLQSLTWSREIQQAVSDQPSAVSGDRRLERLLTAQLWELLVTDGHGQ